MKQSTVAAWTPFRPATYSPDPATSLKMMKVSNTDELFKNSRYTVAIRHLPEGWTHLSIKRNDRSPIRDWRELQRIKNELCGPEREGIELFPAESRLVDVANQFHLWVAPLGTTFPIGFSDRMVADGTGIVGAKQEGFEDRPGDLEAATALVKSFEKRAAEQFPVGSPEYHNSIIEQHQDYLKTNGKPAAKD